MYNIQCPITECKMYSVYCTVYGVHCTMYTVQNIESNCRMYTVQCIMYTVHCIVSNCTVYNVQCILIYITLDYNVQCALYKNTSNNLFNTNDRSISKSLNLNPGKSR